MMLACPICEAEVDAPEIDGEVFACPICKEKLQVFNIGGFWEIHKSMKSENKDEEEE